MDRRTLFKSAGLLFGSALLSQPLFAITPKKITSPKALDENHPLLLNFNENSLGMSPAARRAIDIALTDASRYPDAARETLIDTIANTHHINTNQIMLGNGSSEVIRAAIEGIYHAFQHVPLQLVVPDPTFNYAELYAKTAGIPVTNVPLTAEFAFDLAAMQQKVADFNGRSIVYLCNPNNPTATITPAADIEKWIASAPDTFFILDEAYAEYVTDPAFQSGILLLAQGAANVIVTRTFSKCYALAGLRIGYGVSTPALCKQIEPFFALDNTNTAGAAAAIAALHDTEFFRNSLKSTAESRRIVTAALDELQLAYLPSQTNFIFHRVKGEVKTYQERMKTHHVFVGREFPPAVGWNRLTLGTPQEMQQFVRILAQFREKGWV